ncbi:MAG: 3-deoxy-7-phosphoheptulonate synthase [Planctomycetota bacterium]|jgi:3-deoxy-7-phosphoheptulonate synthase
MFLVLRPGCGAEDRQRIVRAIATAGLSVQISEGHHRIVIGVLGEEDRLRDVALERYPGVERVIRLKAPYRLVARETHGTDSLVRVGAASIGGRGLTIIAGPCAVEDEETTLETARAAKAAGAHLLRGGAFKPRTSPYNFQGLGERGLRILRDTREEVGLPVVTEAMDTRHIALVAKYADMIQIGTRNMQNYPLLKAAAEAGLPVLLKRGRACTVNEWLCAAEYILEGGNGQVALCERGLVSFDTAVRNLLDLSVVPLVKRLSHLPVIVDPSHATGRCELVSAMARAAVAAGADGVMVEIHPRPERALSDARQALLPEELARLVPDLVAIHEIVKQNAANVVG